MFERFLLFIKFDLFIWLRESKLLKSTRLERSENIEYVYMLTIMQRVIIVPLVFMYVFKILRIVKQMYT